MKVKALIVAAMVITSVNAGWLDTFMGWFGIDRGSQGSVSSPNLPDSTLDEARDLFSSENDPADGSDDGDEKPTCDSIIAYLNGLQVRMLGLAQKYQDQLPALYSLKKKAANGLKDEEMEGYYASRRKVEVTLKGIKAEFTNSNARHSKGWTNLTGKGCWNEYLHLMSPEEMIKVSVFLDKLLGWSGYEKPHEDGVRILYRK
ncbi:hypothetical protein BASA61_000677 [Batrachochytrium salamandrivorans]|nr:hypothetical protein BASA61_001477 [Batrachochytrium salamandrivorans]KAH6602857.1 hypothetical protein BASA61_000677 [Batrachochytrium salamandrivorans]KAH9253273.1 hypothetical protein BASA81_008784 [Batrachochytrium salamandrivorans]KAH9274900.1 hypothetical protein BASA83_002612 [Batrachochytrium salamandrivorans]